MLKKFVIISVMCIQSIFGDAGTDYNEVNNDGSFSFGLSNDDIGGHYHTATGSSNKIVRGRYGSRNPETGRIEETIYTAGPRGFRARGPSIHRRMDLSQYPPGPIGSPDDPLADPYDDPSYSFSYRTSEHERKEEADSTGRVRGLYSYLDDIGERHTVRYAAGQGTGFEVLNSVPDTPASVAYNSPLYKAPRRTRGRMSVQRGPDGQYRFISSGPDQRRSETSGPDGVVRGSYSYLDDKGVQRTVQYIAGPGIGYRIVKNLVGPGTHVTPGAAISPTYGIRDYQSNNLDDDGYLRTAESGRIRPKDDSLDNLDSDKDSLPIGLERRPSDGTDYGESDASRGEGNRRPGTGEGRARNRLTGSNEKDYDFLEDSRNNVETVSGRRRGETSSGRGRGSLERGGFVTSGDEGISTKNRSDGKDRTLEDREQSRGRNDLNSAGQDGYARGYEYSKGSGGKGRKPDFSSSDYDDGLFGKKTGHSSSRDRGFDESQSKDGDSGRRRKPNLGDDESRTPGNRRPSGGRRPTDRTPGYGRRPNADRGFDDYGSDFPLVTENKRRLEIDRDGDWSARGRDSTVIKNVGNWYVGLPPGSAVRAHVQSIDLLPLGGRAVAPSEALLRDELKST